MEEMDLKDGVSNAAQFDKLNMQCHIDRGKKKPRDTNERKKKKKKRGEKRTTQI